MRFPADKRIFQEVVRGTQEYDERRKTSKHFLRGLFCTYKVNVYFQKIKEEKDEMQKEYGVAVVDGHKEKIGNFRIEPPGLFRGRGTHPKMGMLKRRVMPEDVIINCSK